MIRILDNTKEFVNKNYDNVATLFIQELLRLQYIQPDSILINTFEISENGKQIAYATLPYLPLSFPLDDNQQVINPKDPKVIDKLLKDVLSDIEFLWKDLQMRKIMDILGPENICFMKEKDAHYLGNWAKILEYSASGTENLANTTTNLNQDLPEKQLTSQDLAAEIKALAYAVLKLNKQEYDDIEGLRAIRGLNSNVYDLAVSTKLSDIFKDSIPLQNQIAKMLSLDPQNLPSLEELKGMGPQNLPSTNINNYTTTTPLTTSEKHDIKIVVVEESKHAPNDTIITSSLIPNYGQIHHESESAS